MPAPKRTHKVAFLFSTDDVIKMHYELEQLSHWLPFLKPEGAKAEKLSDWGRTYMLTDREYNQVKKECLVSQPFGDWNKIKLTHPTPHLPFILVERKKS